MMYSARGNLFVFLFFVLFCHSPTTGLESLDLGLYFGLALLQSEARG